VPADEGRAGELAALVRVEDIRFAMVFVERLWRSVKYEEVYLRAYDSVGEVRASIGRYLNFYNVRRPHSNSASASIEFDGAGFGLAVGPASLSLAACADAGAVTVTALAFLFAEPFLLRAGNIEQVVMFSLDGPAGGVGGGVGTRARV
jgi:hypothetical protein